MSDVLPSVDFLNLGVCFHTAAIRPVSNRLVSNKCNDDRSHFARYVNDCFADDFADRPAAFMAVCLAVPVEQSQAFRHGRLDFLGHGLDGLEAPMNDRLPFTQDFRLRRPDVGEHKGLDDRSGVLGLDCLVVILANNLGKGLF